MKRSAQIGLVIGTLGVAGASGQYLMSRQDACRDDAQPAVTGNAPTDCRRSGSSGGSSSSRTSSYFGSSGSSDSSRGSGRPILPSASTPSSSTSEAARGGFGSIGRAIAAFSGGS
jgi:hypothetical protein